jgi:SHS2 domain-containing protein
MYRWVDHIGELELEISAETEEDTMREAVAALSELLSDEPDSDRGEPLVLDVSLSAPDRPGLLADWLSEIVFLAETEGFFPEAVRSLELRGNRVTAQVEGSRGDPRHLVKAVTLHRLAFEPVDGGWRATVVLDV